MACGLRLLGRDREWLLELRIVELRECRMPKKKSRPSSVNMRKVSAYRGLLDNVVSLLETARHDSARYVNAIMTATYWEVGRRIVEVQQGGRERAVYGTELIERLSKDLLDRFGRGFSQRNLEQMRQFYLCWRIPQTASAESEAKLMSKPLSKAPVLRVEKRRQCLRIWFTILHTSHQQLQKSPNISNYLGPITFGC